MTKSCWRLAFWRTGNDSTPINKVFGAGIMLESAKVVGSF